MASNSTLPNLEGETRSRLKLGRNTIIGIVSVIIFLGLLVLFITTLTEKKETPAETDPLVLLQERLYEAEANYEALQEQLNNAEAELKALKEKDAALTQRMDKIYSELSKSIKEKTYPTKQTSIAPALLSNLTFENACKLASSAETPEEILMYITYEAQNGMESISIDADKASKLYALLLSNPNTTSDLLIQILNEPPFTVLPLIASSEANDEVSTYVLATYLSRVFPDADSDAKVYILSAAKTLLARPKLTRGTLSAIYTIGDPDILQFMGQFHPDEAP